MSSLLGILCLLSALAATSYSYSCTRCSSIMSQCSVKNTCPSGEGCGSSDTEGSTGGKNAAFPGRSGAWSSACDPLDSTSAHQEKARIITACCNTDDCTLRHPECENMADTLAKIYACAAKCNFLASMHLQQVQIRMGTLCYGNPNCTLSSTLPTENSTLNGLVCPSCVSTNSTWCHTDETIQCRGDETVCLLLQTTKEKGSMSALRAFRGCATKSFCDLGSRPQNQTGSSTQVKFSCTRASTRDRNSSTNDSAGGSTNDSTSVHKVILTPATVCLLLLKLLF